MSDKTEQKTIRVLWGSVDDIEFRYANQLYVTHAGNAEFHLTFGHFVPPNTTGLKNDEIPDEIKIKPVACLVVTKENIESFIKVLQENFEGLKTND